MVREVLESRLTGLYDLYSSRSDVHCCLLSVPDCAVLETENYALDFGQHIQIGLK